MSTATSPAPTDLLDLADGLIKLAVEKADVTSLQKAIRLLHDSNTLAYTLGWHKSGPAEYTWLANDLAVERYLQRRVLEEWWPRLGDQYQLGIIDVNTPSEEQIALRLSDLDLFASQPQLNIALVHRDCPVHSRVSVELPLYPAEFQASSYKVAVAHQGHLYLLAENYLGGTCDYLLELSAKPIGYSGPGAPHTAYHAVTQVLAAGFRSINRRRDLLGVFDKACDRVDELCELLNKTRSLSPYLLGLPIRAVYNSASGQLHSDTKTIKQLSE